MDIIFKALADSHRRHIVAALCESPHVAGELADLAGLAPNAVSFHLKWLRAAGLIDVQRQGRHLHYRLNPTTLTAWRRQVESLFPHDKATPSDKTSNRSSTLGRRRGRTAQPRTNRSDAARSTRPDKARSKLTAASPPPSMDSFDDPLPTELL